jgi:REP-associated tyrosine transposase
MLRCCQNAIRKAGGDFGAICGNSTTNMNHVHLLGEYLPKVPVPALVNSLKGVPARRLRPEFTGRVNQHIMHGHFWSPSYFAAPCGRAPLSVIRRYTEQQRHPVNATSGANPALKDGACARPLRSRPTASVRTPTATTRRPQGGNGPDGGPEGPIAHRNGRMVRRASDRATL